MRSITVYTDGSCYPNPGPGGWAAILIGDTEFILTGGEVETTVNRMEMTAVLEALRNLKPGEVEIWSDSQYVTKGIGTYDGGIGNGRLVEWMKYNWKNSTGGEVKNRDLWEEIYEEVIRHEKVKMRWLRGHAGNTYNDRCDKLALEERKKYGILYSANSGKKRSKRNSCRS